MPRKRHGAVHESPRQLEDLACRYAGREEELRIRMLQLMQKDDELTMARTAELIHCSERSVRRWWHKYQELGLAALLDEKSGGGREELRTIQDTRIIQRPDADDTVPPRISRFLNALPVMADTVQWVTAFKEALQTFLRDVDNITINIDIYSEGDARHNGKTIAFVTEHVGTARHAANTQPAIVNRQPGSQGGAIVATMSVKGFPLHRYHPPLVLDYHTASSVYIGSIILWREATQRKISERTIRTMKQLEPFLIFLLSDCAARRRHRDPGLQVFTRIIDAVGEREGLTARQKDVLLQHLLGKGHPEIATALGITVAAIRKHINRIYQDTGATNLNELIARSFASVGKSARSPRRKAV